MSPKIIILSLMWSLFYSQQLFISAAAPPPTASGDIRPVNYNPLRPPKKGDSPVKVKVNIHVNTLLSVEEFEQVFYFFLYFNYIYPIKG